jgi:hypothetical protein
MSLVSGTRKRPPQSGFVQTGMWEITPGKVGQHPANRIGTATLT